MPMTVTITQITHTSAKKIIFDWESAADGTFSGATTAAFDGKAEGFTTIPDGGGDAPTDNYDITITDADGHDILLGAGANRDTANTEHVAGTSLAAAAGSTLTINGSNAGNAKKGVAVLWIR